MPRPTTQNFEWPVFGIYNQNYNRFDTIIRRSDSEASTMRTLFIVKLI